MKKLIYLTFLIIAGLAAKAQDKIYKTNGEVLETKVLEVGSSEVKYKIFANESGPIYTLGKSMILKIVYENGSIEKFDTPNVEEVELVEYKRAQNIFVEVLGQGLLFTANYDTRFGNKRNGLGGRIGFGAMGDGDGNVITVPVSLNYLLGDNNGKHFFEVGIGATYASAEIFDSNGSAIIGTMSFMYRLQPVKSGFSFRGGFTPVYSEGEFIPYWPGLSLGYTF